jgi:hypothetical protein
VHVRGVPFAVGGHLVYLRLTKYTRPQVRSRGERELWLVGFDPVEEAVEVVVGEGPLKWLGDLAVVVAEAEQPLGERVEGAEVVGCECFALR